MAMISNTNYTNTSSSPIIIGVDNGYGNMKTAHTVFPTGILHHAGEPVFKNDMLVYEGKYYTVGEGLKEFLPDKAMDEDYFLLTLAAIGKELDYRGVQNGTILLAVGLPLAWVSEQKRAFAAYLSKTRSLSFTFNGKRHLITIAGVEVYPQGFAAIAPHLKDFQGVNMESLPVSFLTIATVVSSVFYYIWLHLQFVREHERDLMAAQRIQIMMTQIQPHFLFNALNTIRALYAKDPPLADTTLENFSTYLRQNLESLSQSDLIPVSKELEHTRLYAEIETLRFPSIHIEYHIQDDHFDIPALSVQPLVENAIRHGVRGKKDGLVTVSSVREATLHRITVTDNGKGFDPEKTLDGTHIGLRNVKERVEQMCGGKLILQSEIGKGTCITLLIPEGRKEQKP